MKELGGSPSLHGDRQIRVVLKVDQELVLLGQCVLTSVKQDPLPTSPKYEYVVWLYGSRNQGAVFCRWAHRLTPENRLTLFRWAAVERESMGGISRDAGFDPFSPEFFVHLSRNGRRFREFDHLLIHRLSPVW